MNWTEYQKHWVGKTIKSFMGHKATVRKFDGIEVLDFRKPDSAFYAVRVVFDNERSRVYISGDIGEAVIYPTCPATLQDMAECFTCRDDDGTIRVNTEYFLEKVRATSDRYIWDSKSFEEDFRMHCTTYSIEGADSFLEHNGWLKGGISVDEVRGITLSPRARDDLKRMDADYLVWFYDCGKRVSVRIIAWLVALRLAYEAIKAVAKTKEEV